MKRMKSDDGLDEGTSSPKADVLINYFLPLGFENAPSGNLVDAVVHLFMVKVDSFLVRICLLFIFSCLSRCKHHSLTLR